MNKININFIDVEILDFNPEFFVLWFNEIVNQNKKTLGEISLIFCSDDYILNLNRESLDHDYYTDIITFDYCFSDVISGDLFISIDTVKSNAIKYDQDFLLELKRVCAHGVLHLCGYNDKTDLEIIEMRKQERFWVENVPRETFLN